MKQLLFIFIFSSVLMAGHVWGQKARPAKSSANLWLTTDLNISGCLSIASDEITIDEQDTNGLDGYDHFAYLPDIQFNLLRECRLTLKPVILFTHQIKVLTLVTDLPPPLLS